MENKKEMTAYKEFLEKCDREFKFLNSQEGEELQLCLVAQGYKDRLFGRYMVLLGSGFSAIKFIKYFEDIINGN